MTFTKGLLSLYMMLVENLWVETRLQKIAYLSQLAGYSNNFPFEYRHFGPYSEELADAMDIAVGLRIVEEQERPTDWGGWYSTFRVPQDSGVERPQLDGRSRFVKAAAEVSSIELELAATAAFLYVEHEMDGDGAKDPWEETRRLKPEKAQNGRLERAKVAYKRLKQLEAPEPLPDIA